MVPYPGSVVNAGTNVAAEVYGFSEPSLEKLYIQRPKTIFEERLK